MLATIIGILLNLNLLKEIDIQLQTLALTTETKTFKTMTKEVSNIYRYNFDFYKKLIATNPEVELKGASMPYTSYNGNMFSYLEKDGSLGLRLPTTELENFLKKYKTTLFLSYGIVKKEFVLVPDKLLKNTKELKPYFDISFEYVKTLKAKPTKK